MRLSATPLHLAWLVAFGGCASGGGGPQTGPPVVVEVQNNNYADATVYALLDGERQRLGVVIGKSDESFGIPWRPNLYLRLEVRFLGGAACATDYFPMDPGQHYVLDLQPDLRMNLDCKLIGS